MFFFSFILSFVFIYFIFSVVPFNYKNTMPNGPFDECIDVLIFICSLFNTLTQINKCDKFSYLNVRHKWNWGFFSLFRSTIFFRLCDVIISYFFMILDEKYSNIDQKNRNMELRFHEFCLMSRNFVIYLDTVLKNELKTNSISLLAAFESKSICSSSPLFNKCSMLSGTMPRFVCLF